MRRADPTQPQHADGLPEDLRVTGGAGESNRLAARLRELPGGDQLRLIAVTGYGREEDVKAARDAGFDEHLVKPVEFDVLLARLSALLERAAAVS